MFDFDGILIGDARWHAKLLSNPEMRHALITDLSISYAKVAERLQELLRERVSKHACIRKDKCISGLMTLGVLSSNEPKIRAAHLAEAMMDVGLDNAAHRLACNLGFRDEFLRGAKNFVPEEANASVEAPKDEREKTLRFEDLAVGDAKWAEFSSDHAALKSLFEDLEPHWRTLQEKLLQEKDRDTDCDESTMTSMILSRPPVPVSRLVDAMKDLGLHDAVRRLVRALGFGEEPAIPKPAEKAEVDAPGAEKEEIEEREPSLTDFEKAVVGDARWQTALEDESCKLKSVLESWCLREKWRDLRDALVPVYVKQEIDSDLQDMKSLMKALCNNMHIKTRVSTLVKAMNQLGLRPSARDMLRALGFEKEAASVLKDDKKTRLPARLGGAVWKRAVTDKLRSRLVKAMGVQWEFFEKRSCWCNEYNRRRDGLYRREEAVGFLKFLEERRVPWECLREALDASKTPNALQKFVSKALGSNDVVVGGDEWKNRLTGGNVDNIVAAVGRRWKFFSEQSKCARWFRYAEWYDQRMQASGHADFLEFLEEKKVSWNNFYMDLEACGLFEVSSPLNKALAEAEETLEKEQPSTVVVAPTKKSEGVEGPKRPLMEDRLITMGGVIWKHRMPKESKERRDLVEGLGELWFDVAQRLKQDDFMLENSSVKRIDRIGDSEELLELCESLRLPVSRFVDCAMKKPLRKVVWRVVRRLGLAKEFHAVYNAPYIPASNPKEKKAGSKGKEPEEPEPVVVSQDEASKESEESKSGEKTSQNLDRMNCGDARMSGLLWTELLKEGSKARKSLVEGLSKDWKRVLGHLTGPEKIDFPLENRGACDNASSFISICESQGLEVSLFLGSMVHCGFREQALAAARCLCLEEQFLEAYPDEAKEETASNDEQPQGLERKAEEEETEAETLKTVSSQTSQRSRPRYTTERMSGVLWKEVFSQSSEARKSFLKALRKDWESVERDLAAYGVCLTLKQRNALHIDWDFVPACESRGLEVYILLRSMVNCGLWEPALRVAQSLDLEEQFLEAYPYEAKEETDEQPQGLKRKAEEEEKEDGKDYAMPRILLKSLRVGDSLWTKAVVGWVREGLVDGLKAQWKNVLSRIVSRDSVCEIERECPETQPEKRAQIALLLLESRGFELSGFYLELGACGLSDLALFLDKAICMAAFDPEPSREKKKVKRESVARLGDSAWKEVVVGNLRQTVLQGLVGMWHAESGKMRVRAQGVCPNDAVYWGIDNLDIAKRVLGQMENEGAPLHEFLKEISSWPNANKLMRAMLYKFRGLGARVDEEIEALLSRPAPPKEELEPKDKKDVGAEAPIEKHAADLKNTVLDWSMGDVFVNLSGMSSRQDEQARFVDAFQEEGVRVLRDLDSLIGGIKNPLREGAEILYGLFPSLDSVLLLRTYNVYARYAKNTA